MKICAKRKDDLYEIDFGVRGLGIGEFNLDITNIFGTDRLFESILGFLISDT